MGSQTTAVLAGATAGSSRGPTSSSNSTSSTASCSHQRRCRAALRCLEGPRRRPDDGLRGRPDRAHPDPPARRAPTPAPEAPAAGRLPRRGGAARAEGDVAAGRASRLVRWWWATTVARDPSFSFEAIVRRGMRRRGSPERRLRCPPARVTGGPRRTRRAMRDRGARQRRSLGAGPRAGAVAAAHEEDRTSRTSRHGDRRGRARAASSISPSSSTCSRDSRSAGRVRAFRPPSCINWHLQRLDGQVAIVDGAHGAIAVNK